MPPNDWQTDNIYKWCSSREEAIELGWWQQKEETIPEDCKGLIPVMSGILDPMNRPIIFCSGAYAPIHKGHVIPALLASRCNDYATIVFSPSCLEYVERKTTEDRFNNRERIKEDIIRIIEENYKQYNFQLSLFNIAIDPWCYQQKEDQNFSYLLRRMVYLRQEVGEGLLSNIPLYYLIGQDRSNFGVAILKQKTWPFLKPLISVRPGYQDYMKECEQKYGVHFKDMILSGIDESSTRIRNYINKLDIE